MLASLEIIVYLCTKLCVCRFGTICRIIKNRCKVEITIIKEIIAALIASIALYVGFINKLRTDVTLLKDKLKTMDEKCKEMTEEVNKQVHLNTVLEEKVKKMETRQDSFSKKNDDVINLITEFKIEMVKKIGDVQVQMGKIQSDVEVINNTIAVFDAGVVSKKKKK